MLNTINVDINNHDLFTLGTKNNFNLKPLSFLFDIMILHNKDMKLKKLKVNKKVKRLIFLS